MKIKDIRIDGGTQSRVELNNEVVAEYAAAIAAGDQFPPVTVFFDGKEYWLADGFHRYHAHRHAGAMEIDADVRNGTQRDAKLYSAGANEGHGLRRTNADKREAVELLLRDEEWSRWSDRAIARHCKVADTMVGDRRKAICGLTADTAKPGKRKVERNGKVYEQKTDNIGKRPAAAATLPDTSPIAAQKSVEKPAAPAAAQAPVDDAQDDILRDYENLVEENKTLRAIVESTDAGKAALAEVKRLTEVVRVLEERNRGLMNEKNRALEQAKMWMRKAQRAEKAAKEAAEGVAF